MPEDVALDTFRDLLQARDNRGMLTALFSRQLEGGFLSDAPPELRYVVASVVEMPTASNLADGSELFERMITGDANTPASAQMERVILRVNRAALELAQGHLDQFARLLLDAIDVAARSGRNANVILTVDLGWPLLVHRMRNFDVHHAGDTSYGAILYRQADLQRNNGLAEHYQSASLAFGTFSKVPMLGAMEGDWSPRLLRSEAFQSELRSWAEEVDAVAPRWGFTNLGADTGCGKNPCENADEALVETV